MQRRYSRTFKAILLWQLCLGAAAPGVIAAMAAAMLSAVPERLVNRLLVKRVAFGEAWQEVVINLVAFFPDSFPNKFAPAPGV